MANNIKISNEDIITLRRVLKGITKEPVKKPVPAKPKETPQDRFKKFYERKGIL